MAATVHVIDSDDARTEYRMPARVEVGGDAVTLRFTGFDRVYHLVCTPDPPRLTGHTVHRERRPPNRLRAEAVSE